MALFRIDRLPAQGILRFDRFDRFDRLVRFGPQAMRPHYHRMAPRRAALGWCHLHLQSTHTDMIRKVVLMRHGQSAWNLENRFTGWVDVDLTDAGVAEARAAGNLLRTAGLEFDRAYTSVLRRAIRTLNITLEQLDALWLPVDHAWQLNERHYGALQGLNKAEMAAQFGDAQVLQWRRSFDTPPPPLAAADLEHDRQDPRYRHLTHAQFPATECLKDTVARVIPYWQSVIAPAVRSGERVIIAAHGNSLRALVKHLDGMSDEAVVSLNIPTAQPLVYEFEVAEPGSAANAADGGLRAIRHYYLGNAEEIAQAERAVAAQGKAPG